MAIPVSTFTFLFQVDMVTPMCSQLTYEGLLDEVKSQKLQFWIELAWVDFPGRATGGLLTLWGRDTDFMRQSLTSNLSYIEWFHFLFS